MLPVENLFIVIILFLIFHQFQNDDSVSDDNKNTANYILKEEKSIKKDHRGENSGNLATRSQVKEQSYDYVPNYGHVNYVVLDTDENLTSTRAHGFVGTLRNIYNLPAGVIKDPIFLENFLFLPVSRNIVNYSAKDIKDKISEYYDQGSKIIGLGIHNINVSDKPFVAATNSEKRPREIKFAYIQLKDKPNDRIDQWATAESIIESIRQKLNLPLEAFDEVKIAEPSGILFKLSPHLDKWTEKKVVDEINSKKEEIGKTLNIDILKAGIYNENEELSSPSAVKMELKKPNDDQLQILIITCFVIAAIMVSGGTLLLLNKRSKAKEKLYGIMNEKIYPKQSQASLKAKVATKVVQECAVPIQRVTSLSKESDNSPSSRSSTSSWSEEPMTNMDITTGHMVLAYMEDHLKNKARLDTEWAALCAYDPDPCSVSIAQQQENIRKNRFVNALPYDHARVILTALSNINGSDYINASTITDHDPRNAAYIATQGPMENTVCDFWQMIWEQGCVVIVMLTRLSENDTTMCQRYWPSEGAELYNIYEVHLVSEHIWCDDFLVRSFYLKNVKTTETRTVTQFHFLTWPEGGIPPSHKTLLEFRRKVNKSFRGRSCPIVIHCSDGVGRTGCYLLLDMVLNRISKGAKEIDIAATLEHIRDQRSGAVSTKQQFQFVLSAVAEEVQAVLKALPQQQPPNQDPNSENVTPLVQVTSDNGPPVATSTVNESVNKESKK